MKNLFKCAWSLLLIVWTSGAMAQFYVGINAGQLNLNVEKSLVYPLDSVTPTQATWTEAAMGTAGQLVLGYDYVFASQWSAALEADLDLYQAHTEHQVQDWFLDNDVTTQEQLNNGYSVFILPTFHWSPDVAFFLGLGLAYDDVAISYQGASGGNVGVSANVEQRLSGVSVKLGSLVKLTSAFDLQLSYQTTQLGSLQSAAVEPLSGEALQATYKPTFTVFSLGVRYSF